MNITVLAGGVGAARFLEGLVQVAQPKEITVIVNTGDDEEFFGLHVSPDIDTILYTLSGNINKLQGWGLQDETYAVTKQLKKLGQEIWFTLGDKDLATHIHRTALLKNGKSLSFATKDLAEKFTIPFTILPMTDDEVRTLVKTPRGTLTFQEYFVKHHHQDDVLDIEFTNITQAKPAPGVLQAIENADVIIFPPSNPLVSIRSILAIPGVKRTIQKSKAVKIGISPLVGGKAIKGPAAKMFADLHLEPSAKGVATYYRDLLDVFIIDTLDKELQPAIEKIGIKTIVTNTMMKNDKVKKKLAEIVLANAL